MPSLLSLLSSLPWAELALGAKVGSTLLGGLSSQKEAQAKKEADRYRASLAAENAKRASILHLDRAERARREGLLDVGLFRMQAEQSGLSGASADMWVGQRIIANRLAVGRHLRERDEVVSRFLKEEKWYTQSASGAESSGIGSLLAGGVGLLSALVEYNSNSGNGNGSINSKISYK